MATNITYETKAPHDREGLKSPLLYQLSYRVEHGAKFTSCGELNKLHGLRTEPEDTTKTPDSPRSAQKPPAADLGSRNAPPKAPGPTSSVTRDR